MSSQWVTDASNPNVPINLDQVISFELDNSGLIIIFNYGGGARAQWVFSSAATASKVLDNLKVAAAPTAIAEV